MKLEEIKFGYIDRNANPKITKFDKKNLKKEDKFIQIKIEENEYIFVGDLYHRRILKEALEFFGIEYKTKFNRMHQEMPLGIGNSYQIIGAGKIKLSNEKLKFYDASSDYFDLVKGANKRNLEDFFGKVNVIDENVLEYPSFLVNFNI
ncbi:MAG: hypothetical protein WC812_02185 [Candidatus Pacearchaeota archaeon]|jgi:hypothetical protein